MRRETKIKKKSFQIPKWIYISLAYLFISAIFIFHIVNFFLKLFEIYPLLPNYNVNFWQELLILIGAPVFLILSFALSFKSRKFCGALLLFGSALISAGIAFQCGYFLKIYLLKMAVIGLPQILTGILFLKSGK